MSQTKIHVGLTKEQQRLIAAEPSKERRTVLKQIFKTGNTAYQEWRTRGTLSTISGKDSSKISTPYVIIK